MKRYKLNHYYIVQVGEQHPYSMSVGSNGKGWLYEHRHVMEQKLGRILERHEHVHHIDGDKHNNFPENLQLTNLSDHARIHKQQVYGVNNVKFCNFCRKEIYVKQTKYFCNAVCRKSFRIEYPEIVYLLEKPTKILWPSKSELIHMLANSNFVQVGKQLGVSDNAVRKHLNRL